MYSLKRYNKLNICHFSSSIFKYHLFSLDRQDHGSLYTIKLNQSQTSGLAIAFPDRLIRNNSCQTIGNDLFSISRNYYNRQFLLCTIGYRQYSDFSRLLLASVDMSVFLFFIWFLCQKFYWIKIFARKINAR